MEVPKEELGPIRKPRHGFREVVVAINEGAIDVRIGRMMAAGFLQETLVLRFLPGAVVFIQALDGCLRKYPIPLPLFSFHKTGQYA